MEHTRARRARERTASKGLGAAELSSTLFRLNMPPHDATPNREIASKLACFVAALMVNGLLFGGVDYLFSHHMRHHVSIADAEREPTRKLVVL